MNRIKKLFNEVYILVEGKKEAINFLKSKDLNENEIKKILDLDSTPSKAHSIQLGKYYIEIKNFNILEIYYKKFLELKKSNPSLDIFKFKTFQEFENFIDMQERMGGELDIEGEKTPEQVRKEAIYEDENLEIYHADTQKKACDYGHKLGQSYSFCISRPGQGNMFSGYRLRTQSNFYFIKSKNRSSRIVNGKFEDPSHLIVLDVLPNDNLLWTWADNGAQGHGTTNTTWDEVFSVIPELKKPYKMGIFKSRPLTDEERNKLQLFNDIANNQNVDSFNKLSYNEKIEYVTSGYPVSYNIFKTFDKRLRIEFAGMGNEIDEDIYNAFSENERERWEEVRLRILENLL